MSLEDGMAGGSYKMKSQEQLMMERYKDKYSILLLGLIIAFFKKIFKKIEVKR